MATIGSLLLVWSSDASELAADTPAAARGAPFSTSSVQLLGEYLCIVERDGDGLGRLSRPPQAAAAPHV